MSSKAFFGPLLFIAVWFSAGGAGANSTEIHFSGKVRLGGCQVETASKNIEVKLGNIAKSTFSAIGSQSPAKAFSIKLTNCSAVNIAGVKMSGNADNDDARYFAIPSGSGNATGVAVKVWEKNSGDIQTPASNEVAHAIPLGQTTIELEYYAAYVQTLPVVTTGIANSYADYTIEYR
jgi:major type 1 subunit fimbrin (pilin)